MKGQTKTGKRHGSRAAGMCPYEGGEWVGKAPNNDECYFEEMTRTVFQAGLNWDVIRSKWPNFQKAFDSFSTEKVAAYDDKDVARLMKDEGIVRYEKKIKATIDNAQEFLKIKKEYGSFSQYIKSFKGDNERLIGDLRTRFSHMGDSSSRIFLLTTGVKVPISVER